MDFTKLQRPIKILSICLSSSEGGLEYSVVNFADRFRSQNIESIVLCYEGTSIAKKAKDKNVQSVTIPKGSLLLSFLRIRKLLKFYGPDIVVCHRSFGVKMSVLQKVLGFSYRIISISHSLIRYPKKDIIHRFFYRHVDSVIAFTEVHRQNLLEYLPVTPLQVQVVPHFVDTLHFRPPDGWLEKTQLKKDFGYQESDFIFGCVGRFDPQKGQIELIHAAKILQSEGHIFKLLFVGKDTFGEEGYKAQCEKLVQDLGLNHFVQFREHMSNVAKIYRAMDVFVMPSYEETFGLVLLEAMASGCICISTLAGGPMEILEYGNSGILVEPKSSLALAQAMRQVLSSSGTNEQFRVKVQKLAQEKYSRSTFDQAMEKLMRQKIS